jgi:hypothetical protein
LPRAQLGRYEIRSQIGEGGFKKEGRMALTSSLAGRNLGMILLGLWLILTGLLPLLNIRISSTVTTGLAILGIAAGILILIRR